MEHDRNNEKRPLKMYLVLYKDNQVFTYREKESEATQR